MNDETLSQPARRRARNDWTDPPLISQSQRRFSAIALIYVHLWVLEGAVRKWVAGTDNLFYVLRDAFFLVALALLLLVSVGALPRKHRLTGPIIVTSLVLGLGAIGQVIVGMTTLPVAIMGARAYVAPLLLVIGVCLFQPPGLYLRIARTIAHYAIPMFFLVVVQVLSSPSSPVNKEVISDTPRFINGTIVRAMGTFSAPAGLAAFVPIALAMSLALLMRSRKFKDTILYFVASIASIGMVALAGSRLTVLGSAFVLAAFVIRIVVSTRFDNLVRAALFTIVLATIAAMTWSTIQPVLDSFGNRFEQAARAEDSTDRLLEQSFGFLSYPLTPFGDGLGSHTLAGINLGSPYAWVEWDSEKWVAEMGIFGLVLALSRILIASILALGTLFTLSRRNWVTVMAVAAVTPVMFYGQITQLPSNHAFFSIGCALIISSWGATSVGAQDRQREPPRPLLAPTSRVTGAEYR